MAGDPIEGQILLLAAAKASVTPARLPDLVDLVQARVAPDRERYRREYERPHADTDREAFLVEPGHWADLGDALGFDDRELSAVRRAHREQFRRLGRRADRDTEFGTALEIREPLLIGTAGDDPESRDE